MIIIIYFLSKKVIESEYESKQQKKLIKNLERFKDLWVNKYVDDE